MLLGIGSGKALPGEGITDVNNNILLCPHKGLFHAPSLNWENYPDPSCVMLREEEWTAIKEMFKVSFFVGFRYVMSFTELNQAITLKIVNNLPCFFLYTYYI